MRLYIQLLVCAKGNSCCEFPLQKMRFWEAQDTWVVVSGGLLYLQASAEIPSEKALMILVIIMLHSALPSRILQFTERHATHTMETIQHSLLLQNLVLHKWVEIHIRNVYVMTPWHIPDIAAFFINKAAQWCIQARLSMLLQMWWKVGGETF